MIERWRNEMDYLIEYYQGMTHFKTLRLEL